MPEWWREIYDLHHQIWPVWSRSAGDSREMVDFLSSWLDLAGTERVLDLGCGVGREVVEFARRGHPCVGVDVSANLVVLARERARQAGVAHRVRIVEADFRAFSSVDRFDLAYFWDSSLSVFDLDVARSTARRVADLLDPGGWLVIEQLCDAHWRIGRQPVEIRSEKAGPGRTIRSYTYDPATRRLEDGLVHFPPGSAEGQELPTQSLRLYTETELLSLLGEAGLEEIEVVGSDEWSASTLPGDPAGPDTRSISARGRRPFQTALPR